MIKVGKSILELDVIAETFYNEVLEKLSLDTNVQNRLTNATHNGLIDEQKFYKEIQNNLKQIIIGNPNVLEQLTSILSTSYTQLENFRISLLPVNRTKKDVSKAKKILRDEVFALFNYKTFTTNNDGKWAYDHSQRLDLNVCPYCNTQYTFTIRTKRGKTRPQFDHFFNKSKYPFYAISFYNLIPSCYVCNANLKGSMLFKPSTHIHPFIEGIEDTLQFKTNITSVDFVEGKKDFDIVLKAEPKAKSMKLSRAKRNAKVFHIEEQYAFHKKYAGEIIAKSYFYTDSKIDELINEFNASIFTTREEIIEMLFGNYLREEKLHERVLAKLTKNIANEMGFKL